MKNIALKPARAAKNPSQFAAHDALIVEAFGRYPSPNGDSVVWSKAFEANPEWATRMNISTGKAKYRQMIKLYSRTKTVLRQQGKISAISTPRAGNLDARQRNGTVPASSGPWAGQDDLIFEAFKSFPSRTGQTVAWGKAFEAHPEWQLRLGVTNTSSTNPKMVSLYGRTKSVLKHRSSRIAPGQEAAPTPKRRTSKPRAAKPAETFPIPPVIGCSFCPNCGSNLQMHNAVAAQIQLQP